MLNNVRQVIFYVLKIMIFFSEKAKQRETSHFLCVENNVFFFQSDKGKYAILFLKRTKAFH